MSFSDTTIGILPTEWEVVELNNLLIEKCKNGIYKKKEFHGSGVKIVNMGELFAYDKISTQDMKRVELDDNEKKRFLLKNGDLLFARRSLIAEGAGKSSIVDDLIEETTFESSIISLRFNMQLVNPYFIYHYFRSRIGKHSMDSIMRQTAVAGIAGSDLIKLCVPLPSLVEQKAIVATLSFLDNKIGLNNRINKNLEDLVQALFKSWFVVFEPFQDGEFENSELGRIPTGWRVCPIEEISKDIVCGKTPPTKDKDNYGDLMPFITIPDMHGNIHIIKTERYLSPKGIITQSNKTLPKNSVLVSCIATPGLVVLTSEQSQTNQQINSIICKDNISYYYIFLYMKVYSNKIKDLGSGGSTTLNLNKTQFAKIKLIVPIDQVLSEFHNLVKPLFEKIFENQKQTENLTAIRDSLLPKLMSGEIRVPIEEVH